MGIAATQRDEGAPYVGVGFGGGLGTFLSGLSGRTLPRGLGDRLAVIRIGRILVHGHESDIRVQII